MLVIAAANESEVLNFGKHYNTKDKRKQRLGESFTKNFKSYHDDQLRIHFVII